MAMYYKRIRFTAILQILLFTWLAGTLVFSLDLAPDFISQSPGNNNNNELQFIDSLSWTTFQSTSHVSIHFILIVLQFISQVRFVS